MADNISPHPKGKLLRVFAAVAVLLALVWGLLWPIAVAVLDTGSSLISYRGDTTNYNPWTGTLTTSGNMSPGFSRTVATYIYWRPLRRVEVNLAGGVLEEALSTARQIESRLFVTVVARERCNYACVLVLLAGDERLARYDMSLELGDDSGSELKSSGQARERVLAERVSRLRGRGIPESLLMPSSADTFAAHEQRKVSALDLVRWGALTGLVDADGRRISLKEAEIRIAGENPSQ